METRIGQVRVHLSLPRVRSACNSDYVGVGSHDSPLRMTTFPTVPSGSISLPIFIRLSSRRIRCNSDVGPACADWRNENGHRLEHLARQCSLQADDRSARRLREYTGYAPHIALLGLNARVALNQAWLRWKETQDKERP